MLAVDEKYSPKLDLYNVAKGTVGRMKIKKDLFKRRPLKVGDVITIYDFDKRPARMYVNGKSVINPSVQEIWLKEYKILSA